MSIVFTDKRKVTALVLALVLIIVIMLCISITQKAKAEGVTLIGPNQIKFNQTYTYTLQVVPSQSLDNAIIIFSNSTYYQSQTIHANLKKDHTYNYSFKTKFYVYPTINNVMVSYAVLGSGGNIKGYTGHKMLHYSLKNIKYGNAPIVTSG